MKSIEKAGESRVGIYVRESRDDSGKNIETIETQRDLLLEYVSRSRLGVTAAIYMDDNVSGSSFEREGLNLLKADAEAGKLDIVLVKDLSRLGRNNAKTLLFLDYLEELGVRVLTYDNRYDSKRDDDLAGIETWANERYVRDISRKIRASLRFKIERGEYIGHAPFGYRKSISSKNRLEPDPEKADTVRGIFKLYRQGYGYASIAGMLNSSGAAPPSSTKWSGTAVRRILMNRVYTGQTVQGVSEKISFKSSKTRRLPPERHVVTADTHEAIINTADFLEADRIRKSRKSFAGPHKKDMHILRGLLYCGGCGSVMYARKRAGAELAYVCGNYFRNGGTVCSSHLVYEAVIVEAVLKELRRIAGLPGMREKAAIDFSEAGGMPYADPEARCKRIAELEKLLAIKRRQKERVYIDRVEDRIDLPMYVRVSRGIDERITACESEIMELRVFDADGIEAGGFKAVDELLGIISGEKGRVLVTNELVRHMAERIVVYNPGEVRDAAQTVCSTDNSQDGLIVFNFTYCEI